MDKYSKLSSLIRGAVDTGSLGFSDEIAGGLTAAKDVLINDTPLSEIGAKYTEARDEYRDMSKALEKENPKSYMAGQAVGALGSMILPGAAIKAPSLAKAALSGAGYGALAGAGTSEDNTVSDALKGAAVGAAGGAMAKKAVDSFGALKGMLNPQMKENTGIGKALSEGMSEMGGIAPTKPRDPMFVESLKSKVEDLAPKSLVDSLEGKRVANEAYQKALRRRAADLEDVTNIIED